MLSKEEKEKIVKRLNERFGELEVKCPMCGNNTFSVSDGYFSNVIQNNLDSLKIAGPSIPAISIICSKCGFISMHALGTLGLLPSQEKGEK